MSGKRLTMSCAALVLMTTGAFAGPVEKGAGITSAMRQYCLFDYSPVIQEFMIKQQSEASKHIHYKKSFLKVKRIMEKRGVGKGCNDLRNLYLRRGIFLQLFAGPLGFLPSI